MSEYVIVRINEKLIPEFQINYDSNKNTVTQKTIASWSEIIVKSHQQLLLLMSANHVFNTHIKIPSKNEDVIRQSLPYAVEEHLANDVDDNHYAFRELGDQLLVASVISKEVMNNIHQQLESAQLKCQHIYSEIYSVPSIEGFNSFIISDDYVVVRNKDTGTTLKRSFLGQYLKLSDNKMHVAYSDSDLKLPTNSSITLNKQDTVLLQAKTLVKQMLSGDVVNLLQGDYRDNDDQSKNSHPLKRLIILSSLLVISWLIINGYRLWSLNDDIKTIKSEQLALFLELVPNANNTEMNDPYAALQSRMKLSANAMSDDSKVGFISALGYLGKTLAVHPTIEVQSLRQRKTKLEVNLRASNVNDLNLFQSSLEKNVLAMRVKTGTRNTNKDGISSIITMEQL